MRTSRKNSFALQSRALAGLALVLLTAGFAAAADDVPLLEADAIRAVMTRVAPCVVRIETIGGVEKVDNVKTGVGPTTGLIISADGQILTSTYNFAQPPASILVTLPGGNRVAAKLIASDKSRRLALLKVKTEAPLPVPELAPSSEIMVGAWAIGLGRGIDAPEPNVSVGVISATNRLWNRALQTDAKISPVNYGGPLCDIRGRVMGILTSIGPEEMGEAFTVDLYDSGIGFAIPFDHMLKVVPRLAEGKDLLPGLLGISLKSNDIYGVPAIVGATLPNSPAAKAGLKAGDEIVSVEGALIERGAHLNAQLKSRYAGDTVTIAILRGKDRLEKRIELVDVIPPFERPFLGILPERDETAAGGVTARFIYPDSPAAKAGLQAGDRIASFNGAPVATRAELNEKLVALKPGTRTNLAFVRGGSEQSAVVTLAAEPRAIPDAPPSAAAAEGEATAEDQPVVGEIPLKLPEFENNAFLYVPKNYRRDGKFGLVVWLHPAGGLKEDELLSQWREHCDVRSLILLAPKSSDPSRWTSAELDFVRKAVDQTRSTYNIDPTRVAACGQEAGGVLAGALAIQGKEIFRAVATVDGPFMQKPPANDPVNPLSFYVASSSKGRFAAQMRAGVEKLKEMKFALIEHPLGDETRPLDAGEVAELARWIDALDHL